MIHALSMLVFFVFMVPPVYSITMEEAVSYALKNNPEIQGLRLEESIAKGQREKAGLLFPSNPSIEGSLSKKDMPLEEGGGKVTNYGVKLSQEIEIAGQRGFRIEVAEREISRVALEVRDRERVLTSDVKDTFARALALKNRKVLNEEIVKLQEQLLGFSKVKFQAGDISALDVNLAEVELSKAKKELLSTTREYRESLLALQQILGMRPDGAFSIDGELPSDMKALPDKENLKLATASERPDAKASLFEIEKTKAVLSLVKREAIPNVTLSGFYNRDERLNEVGIELSFPIPFIDRKQAEKKEAQAKAAQAEIKSEGLRKTIDKEFEQAYSDLSAAAEELNLFKSEIMSKVAENLSLLNLAYKEGKIGYFEVRLAHKETIETQFAYLESRLRAQLALNAIEKITGGAVK